MTFCKTTCCLVALICSQVSFAEQQTLPLATPNIVTMKNYFAPNKFFYITGYPGKLGSGTDIIIRDAVLVLDTKTLKWTIDYLFYIEMQSQDRYQTSPTVFIKLLDRDGKTILAKAGYWGAGEFKSDMSHCSYHGFEKGHAGGQIGKNEYDSIALSQFASFSFISEYVEWSIGKC